MNLPRMVLFTLILFSAISYVYAETYTWVDDLGTVNFAEERRLVPARFRNKVRKLEVEPNSESRVNSATSGEKLQDNSHQVVPDAGKDGNVEEETYAGKSLGQWKKELETQGNALKTIQKRMDEIALQLKNAAASEDDQDKLLAEHKLLSSKFNELNSEYRQLVENARKAGLQISIQK